MGDDFRPETALAAAGTELAGETYSEPFRYTNRFVLTDELDPSHHIGSARDLYLDLLDRIHGGLVRVPEDVDEADRAVLDVQQVGEGIHQDQGLL